jgi:hypothetical protein
MYLVGQYFCWVEIVRRESQFLDPRSNDGDRKIANQCEQVRNAFASSNLPGSELRIFRGQQRAMGEVLLDPIERASAGLPRWDCLGYAAFVERSGDDRFNRWFGPLRTDLTTIADDPGRAKERIVAIQHELLGLVELLDPEAARTSGKLRERL